MRALMVLLLTFLLCFLQVDTAMAISESSLNEITKQWQGSAHAMADVNCSSCHQAEKNRPLLTQPTHESCQSCHESEVDTFLFGKHGIRLLEGQSPLVSYQHVQNKAMLGKEYRGREHNSAQATSTSPFSTFSRR